MRLTTAFLALLLVPRLAGAQQPTFHPYVPASGFVPDSVTAVGIAVAVWGPIYGPIAPEQPVAATLDDGVWTVTGGVHRPGLIMMIGGIVVQGPPMDTVVVKIAKRDGRVLYQGRS